MASTSSYITYGSKNKPTINHDYSTNLQPMTYERTISAGKSITGLFRPDSYWTEAEPDLVIPVQKVSRYEEYIAGCIEHERCSGHFCITPGGNILLPQSLASSMGIMSNDLAKMAEAVFTRDTVSQGIEYRNKLRKLMLGKSGKMRGDMPSGTVDSSAREVISLSWDLLEGQFAIPRKVAENMRVLREKVDETTGLPIDEYIEDNLREGDTVLVVRPPSLWAGNVQPCKVIIWDHECFGLEPSVADDFHADHDGDEMQIYFIGTRGAIEECNKWTRLREDKFKSAVLNNPLPISLRKIVHDKRYSNEDEYITNRNYSDEIIQEIRKQFMIHSTVSIRELIDGEPLGPLSKPARMKEPMINMFVQVCKDPQKTLENYYKSSQGGVVDVMNQQLHQGTLGDMSRQARIAASCIQYKGSGIFYVHSSTEVVRKINVNVENIVIDKKYSLGGNSCMRGITALCSIAQQAALDSHRVSTSVAAKMDLISNLIVGGQETLIAVKSGTNLPYTLKYVDGNITYYIVDVDSVAHKAMYVIGAYNPVVLKAVELIRGDMKSVCRVGISMVCNYYGLVMSKLELESVVELFSYKVSASHKPITTKDGMLIRELRWMPVLFANHYGKLEQLQSKNKTRRPVTPQTITDSAALCNFRYMN